MHLVQLNLDGTLGYVQLPADIQASSGYRTLVLPGTRRGRPNRLTVHDSALRPDGCSVAVDIELTRGQNRYVVMSGKRISRKHLCILLQLDTGTFEATESFGATIAEAGFSDDAMFRSALLQLEKGAKVEFTVTTPSGIYKMEVLWEGGRFVLLNGLTVPFPGETLESVLAVTVEQLSAHDGDEIGFEQIEDDEEDPRRLRRRRVNHALEDTAFRMRHGMTEPEDEALEDEELEDEELEDETPDVQELEVD